MKRISILICAAVFAFSAAVSASALGKAKMGIANHVGLSVGVGTTGVGIEAATPISPFVQARAGVHIMPGIKFNVNSDVTINTAYGPEYSEIDLDGSLKRLQGSLIFNVYPLGNRFPLFVAVGAFFGGRDMVKIDGYCPGVDRLGSYVEVGDYELPLDEHGYARGAIRTSSFRPYLGIGTGRPCPVGRLNFMWELGLQFQKSPYLWDDINRSRVELSDYTSDDTFQKIMDKLSVYPVLKFTLSGRIF